MSLFFVLASCGFHLRGMVDMPPWLRAIAIINQSNNRQLQPWLAEQLQAYHIRVLPEPAMAQYWLIIEHDEMQEQIKSISSSTTPRQYQLIYTVFFKLQNIKGGEVIPTSQVLVTRQMTINSDRILGSTGEADLLKREMQHDAVIQIITRLSHAHDH
jgi:LPS-assembly lipoprotein